MADLNLRSPTSYSGQLGTQYKQGAVRFATDAEAAEGIATNCAVTPSQASTLSVPDATTTVKGKVELATNAETVTGTDTERAVVPAGLTARLAAPGPIGATTPDQANFTNVGMSGILNFSTAAGGTSYAVATAGGASPQTANGRVVQVTFTGVSIAAAAEQSFVINNSSLGLSSIVEVTMRGATDGAALSIAGVSVSPTAITTTITNGTGATTSTANIVLTATIFN